VGVIDEVTFSRTGKAIYSGVRTFNRLKGGGVYGNYTCVEDGNEYWISGVKERGSNRRYTGIREVNGFPALPQATPGRVDHP
jgi:hypothetical protein